MILHVLSKGLNLRVLYAFDIQDVARFSVFGLRLKFNPPNILKKGEFF
jgi:hypothetical protein